ncbi:DUF554 domain-containing protein [Peptacetobacter hiranonis]|uniref:DUF554 domain-containing protein n=1 Tax=Peptacetobacter hiranonis (strain DSM 13275 / JCM 10541 / KCTC 15199 / TO-931) TaxID=500633 RepID=B6FXD9_PEPHT|nr:DUF554 domain-containing protein [Peptacetobacter hiranonis]EEA85789.1 hypothetical protein CLOHIR_00538 [Peptacetobacter hiranonis DSM 13275]MED9947379.1 DUF554 domain-containing protein [Peptacetobacter hiranonis]QEK20574.1 putative membrane protein YdfK [Peptacetobacter hiranonis]
MIATFVNCGVIIVGCIIGLFIKGGIPERFNKIIMNGLALCAMFIGFSGALEGNNTIITIVSMAVGALIGELIDIDKWLNKLGETIQAKLDKGDGKESRIAEGFVNASLLYCVGAMSIVGALQAGLSGNYDTIYAKTVLDGVSSVIFSASMGIGVIFSSVTVLLYQGGITLCATFLSGILSQAVIAEMTAVGSLMIVGLGLNLLEVTDIKIANLLPGILVPVVLGLIGLV